MPRPVRSVTHALATCSSFSQNAPPALSKQLLCLPRTPVNSRRSHSGCRASSVMDRNTRLSRRIDRKARSTAGKDATAQPLPSPRDMLLPASSFQGLPGSPRCWAGSGLNPPERWDGEHGDGEGRKGVFGAERGGRCLPMETSKRRTVFAICKATPVLSGVRGVAGPAGEPEARVQEPRILGILRARKKEGCVRHFWAQLASSDLSGPSPSPHPSLSPLAGWKASY